MRRKSAKKLIIALALLILFVCTAVLSVSADDSSSGTEPKLRIISKNLSYSESIYVMYAVDTSEFNIKKNEIKMLFWDDVQESYTLGTESYSASSKGVTTVNGTPSAIFYSRGIAAKEMTTDIYCRAYAEIDGEIHYSDVDKFSVLEYVYTMRETHELSDDQKRMFNEMLDYGAAAQQLLNFRTDRIANDIYYSISTVGGTLEDGFTKGLYHASETITLTAPAKNEGYDFIGWKNSENIIVSYDNPLILNNIKQNEVYTAFHVNTCEHEATTVIPGQTPDCINTGLTEGICCLICNQITVAQEIIPKKQHSFVDYKCINCSEYDYTPVENFKFTAINDGTYMISLKSGVEYPEVVILPNFYQGCSVKVLNSSGNALLSGDLKKIIVTNGITAIVGSTFNNKIESVVLSESVIDIDYFDGDTTAFFNATNLKEIVVEENNPVFKSKDGVLYSKDGKTLIHYPANKGLSTFEIPETVEIIDKNSFREANVESVIFHDNIKEIKDRAFTYSDVQSIILPEIAYIGDYTFDSCSSLTSITIPNSVQSIGYSAFGYCDNLSNVVIGNGIKTIEWRAFYSCDALTNVFYAGTDTEWNNINMGSDNTPLVNATLYYYSETKPTDLNKYWRYVDGIPTLWSEPVFSKGLEYTLSDDGTYYIVTGIGTCTETEIVIPPSYNGLSVKEIGKEAFINCDSIANIIIPNSVNLIGDNAFAGCKGLTKFVIPDSVTDIGDYLFYSCINLKEITLSKNITTISYSMFDSCIALTNIDIPEGVTTIQQWAFSYCYSLKKVNLPTTLKTIEWVAFADCISLSSIFIPASVETIQGYAFAAATIKLRMIAYCEAQSKPAGWGENWNGNDAYVIWGVSEMSEAPANDFNYVISNDSVKITKYIGSSAHVIIPNTIDGLPVTAIGDNAFEKCTTLNSVVIPTNITHIGNWVFNYCTNLTAVSISNSVTTIGTHMFCECNSLNSVILPDGITEIKNYTFFGCSNLETVFIPNSVTKIGTSAFLGCINLNSIVLPKNLRTIGVAAFDECGLVNVEIPNQVTEILSYAFADCPNLKCVIIPDSVTDIGYWAFYGSFSDCIIYCEAISTPSSWSSYWNPDNLCVINGYTASKSTEFEYEIKNDGIRINGYNGEDIDIIIPLMIDGLPVTSINDWAFSYRSDLISIIIPYTVTKIGDSAFYFCENLTIYCEAEYMPDGWSSTWNNSDCPVIWDYTSLKYDDSDGTSFEKAYIITCGQTLDAVVDTEGEYIYFIFTATENMTYTFYSSGDYDTHAYLYDIDESLIIYNDSGNNNDFLISWYLYEGETVYIVVGMYSSSTTGTFTVTVN